MALPSSGKISMLQVRQELGESGSVSLGQSSVRSLAERTSGSVSMSHLHGKSDYTPPPPRPPRPPTWPPNIMIR